MFRRYELARAGDFDGAFQFCRVYYRTAARGRRRLAGRFSPRRFKPDDAHVGADQDADQPAARRRAESRDHPVEPGRAVQVPVHHDDGGRQHLPRRSGSQGAPRLPAQGRLPVGRRLLGRVRVGGVGQPVSQGAADRSLPVPRSADGPSDLQSVLHDSALSADSRRSAHGAAPAGERRSGASKAASRMRARCSTTTAGSWSSSPTTPISAIPSKRKRPIASTSSASRSTAMRSASTRCFMR